jgi:hypothetical protein
VHDHYDLTQGQRAELIQAIGVLRGSIAGSPMAADAKP